MRDDVQDLEVLREVCLFLVVGKTSSVHIQSKIESDGLTLSACCSVSLPLMSSKHQNLAYFTMASWPECFVQFP